jgi:hypothetical protein
MSNENPEQTVLLAALKDIQQAIGQLQTPLESLALTQLIPLAYGNNNSNESVAVLKDKYKVHCSNVLNKTADIAVMDEEQAALAGSYAVDLDKEKNALSRQTKQNALDAYQRDKDAFEREHPLIVKLVHSINAIR